MNKSFYKLISLILLIIVTLNVFAYSPNELNTSCNNALYSIKEQWADFSESYGSYPPGYLNYKNLKTDPQECYLGGDFGNLRMSLVIIPPRDVESQRNGIKNIDSYPPLPKLQIVFNNKKVILPLTGPTDDLSSDNFELVFNILRGSSDIDRSGQSVATIRLGNNYMAFTSQGEIVKALDGETSIFDLVRKVDGISYFIKYKDDGKKLFVYKISEGKYQQLGSYVSYKDYNVKDPFLSLKNNHLHLSVLATRIYKLDGTPVWGSHNSLDLKYIPPSKNFLLSLFHPNGSWKKL
ncbi:MULTISPECIES: hypothetical protein [unclassified Francisella]|uniref:hypothetical protein n=1 Tax=unclassified Francisella TaxID=2610885 RepID=UPI002E317363|nr:MULTISPECIES: hypothetical protein [unclassified Francisella]MED7819466.1 hypothetical protein [Francisella sp. 19S2-4]MED7830255.1 hypothetical protein [Francisella sp. 19S2-10]